jgi:retinol-binding protein 3
MFGSTICLAGVFAALVAAPAVPADKSLALDAAARKSAIHSILARIEELYVFPDVAEKMVRAVREKDMRKEYDSLDTGDKLAAKLTEDLQSVSKDKHIRVHYSAQAQPAPPTGEAQPKPDFDLMRRMLERINFGVPKVEVMAGNIGYVRIDLLAPPEFAGDTYSSAMNAVAHTNALIVDLRNCGGAISPHAIPMLTGYFFKEPVHLIDMKWGRDGLPVQSWSTPYVPGKRYLDKPVYVLISRRTFSGAEELAYDLQNLKRATIVGETSGGGANPGGVMRANDHFSVFVPTGRVTSPVTGTNWEGIGVQPDVKTTEPEALARAHRLALEKALASAKDYEEKSWLKEAIDEVGKSK